MPKSRATSRGTLTRLVLFAVLGWALYALRRDVAETSVEQAEEATFAVEPSVAEAAKPVERVRTRLRSRRQRFATSLAFATLFFAGAAFSAGAGDAIVEAMESDTSATCDAASSEAEPTACPDSSAEVPADESQTEAAGDPAEEPAATEAAPEESTDDASSGEEPGTAEEPVGGEEPSTDDATTDTTESGDESSGEPAEGEPTATGSDDTSSNDRPKDDAGASNGESAGPPVLASEPAHAEETAELDPEAEGFGFATVWLHRDLADPVRPAQRLSPAFAKHLRAEARRAGVDWALVLATLRAEGADGRVPAMRRELRSTARELRGLLKGQAEWQTLLALHGRTAFADRAMALTRYNRAVGLRPLVTGFEAAKAQIADNVLSDGRLDIYSAGRSDIAAGRINVRVLVLMRYLAEAYGSVRVSSLQTGHGLYARPGVVSAHIYGLAVDIAALGGTPVMGNSQPGGVTEKGVRDILLLPAELRPRQVISLLGLGGPSFPLANHYDHIHVGF